MRLFVRLRRDERGVSAVIVSICLIAIFGAAMLSVDAGQLWTVRRNAVTATDSSALAQARYFALNPPPIGTTTCTSGVWDTALNANANDLFSPSCQVFGVPSASNPLVDDSGYVVVSVHKRSAARFSGVLGIGGSAAYSMSAVAWGFVTQPLGLRPIALCINDPQIQDALNKGGEAAPSGTSVSPFSYPAPDGSTDYAGRTPGVVHHLDFDSSFTGCGSGVPGNWGWVNLNQYFTKNSNMNNGSNPPDASCADPATENPNKCGLSDWLQYGWNDQVALTSPTDCDVQNSGTQPCNGNTGISNSSAVDNALNYLMNPTAPTSNCGAGSSCNPATIPVILYDSATMQGSSAAYNMVAVAQVRIWAYQLSGSKNSLDLEFMDRQIDGVCCAATPPNSQGPHEKGTRICEVDHDNNGTVLTKCAPSA